MPTSQALPNSEFFRKYLIRNHLNQKALAGHLNVASGTAGKLLAGHKVSRKIIASVAQTLRLPISSLIVMPGEFILPDDPAFYESLKFGYYLDHNRGPDGRIKWHDETLKLKRNRNMKGAWRTFEGIMENTRYGTFQVKASLLNRSQFVLTALGTGEDTAFAAAFSTCHHPAGQPDVTVLCGIWMGTDHALTRTAIFRMFLSPIHLSQDMLYQLTTASPVESVLEDPRQAAMPKFAPMRHTPKTPAGSVRGPTRSP